MMWCTGICINSKGLDFAPIKDLNVEQFTRGPGWDVYGIWVSHGPVSGRQGECIKGATLER